MPKLVAIKEHRYAQKQRMPGDVYEAGDRDAKLLKVARKAKDAEDESVETEAEADSAPGAPAVPKRTYRRRDMKAE